MSGYRKQLRKVAAKRGWTISVRNNSHLRLSKQGCRDVNCSMSPKTDMTIKAVERDMDRAEGLRPDPYATH